jgi:hypothetical protein
MKIYKDPGSKEKLFELMERVNKIKLTEGRFIPAVGQRVKIADGSGVDSNKTGVIVSKGEVKTDGRGVPVNVQGAYKPVDWNREAAIRLDDGELITMFLNRILPLDNDVNEDAPTYEKYGKLKDSEGYVFSIQGIDDLGIHLRGEAGEKVIGFHDAKFYEYTPPTNSRLEEEMETTDTQQILNTAFQKLKSGALEMDQGGSHSSASQSINDKTYVGINGFDSQKNMYNFNFEVIGSETDQDGVLNIVDVELERFYYQDSGGMQKIELDQDDLREFNQKHDSGELYDAIEKYIDVDIEASDDLTEVFNWSIDKKEESDPFGGARQKYQDGMGYGDEKPVNPELRVKAPELEKFVRERSQPERKEDFEGEELLKSKYTHLNSDMEFKKMALAYENLLNLQKNKHRAKYVTQEALSSLRNMITQYLQDEKGLNVRDEDVQNFFTQFVSKYGSVVTEEENEEIPYDARAKKQADKDMSKSDYLEIPDDLKFDIDFADDKMVAENEDEPEKPVPTGDVDRLQGGLGDDAEVEQFDPQQILKGMEVEMEHTDDPRIALEIAMDHLMELPDYYTRLDKMEKEGEADFDGNDNELKKYEDDLKDADEELKDNILGFDIKTPNVKDEE